MRCQSPRSESDTEKLSVQRGDPGGIILCRMDNNSVVRIMGLEDAWTRCLVSDTRCTRTDGEPAIWCPPVPCECSTNRGICARAMRSEKIYAPDFPHHAEEARRAGHGGGDFFTNYHFAEAIRKKRKRPYFDVYRGLGDGNGRDPSVAVVSR